MIKLPLSPGDVVLGGNQIEPKLRHKMFENKFYVYELIDTNTGCVFYVGKGQKYRCFAHEYATINGRISNNNLKLFNKIKKLKNNNIKINYEIPFSSNNEKECYNIEEQLIKKYGIENLCNLYLSNYGVIHTKESKAKISKAHMGKVLSNETKQKLREINLGNKHSQETKNKVSISLKEQYNNGLRKGWNFERTNEWKEKISKAHKGHIHSEESILKMKQTHKGKIISQEQREKIRKTLSLPRINLLKKCEECGDEFNQLVKENLKQPIKRFCSQKCVSIYANKKRKNK